MDNIIRNHKDDFATLVPPDGHEARFMKKMNQLHALPSNRNRWYFAAASVLLIAALSVSALYYFSAGNQNPLHNEGPLSDLATYYDQQLQNCLQAIEQSDIDPEDKIKIRKELMQNQMSDSDFSDVYGEEIMTEYFERKLNRLSFLMARIEDVNQLKKQ